MQEDRLVHEDLTASVEVLRKLSSLGSSERPASISSGEPKRRTSASGLFRKGYDPTAEEEPLEQAAASSRR
jgi:hypothetical protein